MTQLQTMVSQQRVLFISTKNRDYIRNLQEISLLKKEVKELVEIVSSSKSYPKRLIFVYFHVLKALIKGNYDVIFVGFAPQLLFFLFPFFPKSKTLIFDFFISFYDTLVDDRKKFAAASRAAKILHWLDQKTIHKAKLVIADTNAHRQYFALEFQYPQDQIEVLYLQADSSIYQAKNVLFDPQRFEILYFGSILPVQGIDVILEAVKKLETHPEIHFTLIGPVKCQPEDFPNVSFYPWLEQTELAVKISQANLTLAGHFAKDIAKADRTIAGKSYIYEAMKKPMVLGDSAANHELFVADKFHIYVPRGDAQKLAETIWAAAVAYFTENIDEENS